MDTRKPIDEKAQERYDVLFRLVTVWRIADRVVRLETMDDGLEIRNALKSAMGLPTLLLYGVVRGLGAPPHGLFPVPAARALPHCHSAPTP